MIDRERRLGNEGEQQEGRIAARNIQTLLDTSVGFKTSLSEKPSPGDQILIPQTVDFYIPEWNIGTEDTQGALRRLSVVDVTTAQDATPEEIYTPMSLALLFGAEDTDAESQFNRAKRVTFHVNPGSKNPSPVEQGIREYYKTFSPVFDSLRHQSEGYPVFPGETSDDLATDVVQLLRDPNTGTAVRNLHLSVQGTLGVALAIETRNGRKPEVLDHLRAIQKKISPSDGSGNKGFKDIAFYYLAVEPYHNRGARQGQ